MTSLPTVCAAVAVHQQELHSQFNQGSDPEILGLDGRIGRIFPLLKILFILLFLPFILVLRLCLLPFQWRGKMERVLHKMKIRSKSHSTPKQK